MATPTNVLLPPSGDKAVDAVTNGSYWSLDASRTVSWSVSGGYNGEVWSNPAAVAKQVGAVLDIISTYANIDFSYRGSFRTPVSAHTSGADINVSLSGSKAMFPSSNTWARGHFPIKHASPELPGDIFLNINSQANVLKSYEPGSAGWFLLLHELGHTLGLKHPHDDGGTGRPTLSNLGAGKLDMDWFSVMSYNDDYDFNLISFDPATPMPLDVIGLQALYGINKSFNRSNTTYELSRSDLYYTIWDAGGRDVVTASAAGEGWFIALPHLQLSELVAQNFGFAAPVSEMKLDSPTTLAWLEGDIENATGSAFADEIHGNDLNNILRGGDGADRLEGKQGKDLLVGGKGKDALIGGGGADTFDFDSVVESLAGSRRDIVTLVSKEKDRIDLSTIDADTDGTSGNQRFEWVDQDDLDAAFTMVDGQLRFAKGILMADTNGDGKADFEIKIIGAFAAGDVIL